MRTLTTALLVLFCRLAAAGTGDVLRTVAELNAAVDNRAAGLRYDVTAKLVLPPTRPSLTFYAADETGTAMFGMEPSIINSCPTNEGDVVRITGVIVRTSRKNDVGLHSEQVKLVHHGDPPKPTPVSAKRIYDDDTLKTHLVEVSGNVYDAFRDEIDHPWSFVVINSEGTLLYVAVFSANVSAEELDSLVGANVSIRGIVTNHRYGSRITLERYITTHGISSIKVNSPRRDPFDAPEYTSFPLMRSAPGVMLGRRRIFGHVIAVWDNGKRVLMKSDDGGLVRADMKSSGPPRYGRRIEACGIPATDLYRRNLARAIWRYAPETQFQEESPTPVRIKDLFVDSDGNANKNAVLYGRAVKVVGTVRALPPDGADTGCLYLESNSFMLPIDASSCPSALNGITTGCTIAASGTYILETDNLRSDNVFPQISEILVAVRRPDDIKLIAHPPWWTPGRLSALVGALVAVILGAFAWNVSLRRRAERRGRELADEQLAHVTAELKVNERTRLAVELHDALSQTLAGVSMQIDTAAGIVQASEPAAKRCLDLASRTIDSCRMELRNTLWDLRSAALDEPDMNDAIRKTLRQNLAGVDLSVRFNVPRDKFTDNAAHGILKIIRELAANAIRHGKPSSLAIDGTLEGDILSFSVADDGCGFDPDLAPGVGEGHFGLQGIAERLELLNGEMTIDSAPGKGTRINVKLKMKNP